MRAFSKAMGNIDLRGADPAAAMAFIGDATKPGRWRCYFRIFRLAAAASLPTVHSPLQPMTYRTLILLLYGAALRVGEAIRLVIDDMDVATGVLVIRETKFYKYAGCRTMPASCCATANSKAGNKNDSA